MAVNGGTPRIGPFLQLGPWARSCAGWRRQSPVMRGLCTAH